MEYYGCGPRVSCPQSVESTVGEESAIYIRVSGSVIPTLSLGPHSMSSLWPMTVLGVLSAVRYAEKGPRCTAPNGRRMQR